MDLSISFRNILQSTLVAFTINKHKKGFLGAPGSFGRWVVPISLSYLMLIQKSTPKTLGLPLQPLPPGVGAYVRNKRGRDDKWEE